MRFVDRDAVPVPPELGAAAFQRKRREDLEFLSLDRMEREQTRPPDRHLPSAADLLPALAKLFHGKCAFCTRSSLQHPRHPLDAPFPQ